MAASSCTSVAVDNICWAQSFVLWVSFIMKGSESLWLYCLLRLSNGWTQQLFMTCDKKLRVTKNWRVLCTIRIHFFMYFNIQLSTLMITTTKKDVYKTDGCCQIDYWLNGTALQNFMRNSKLSFWSILILYGAWKMVALGGLLHISSGLLWNSMSLVQLENSMRVLQPNGIADNVSLGMYYAQWERSII